MSYQSHRRQSCRWPRLMTLLVCIVFIWTSFTPSLVAAYTDAKVRLEESENTILPSHGGLTEQGEAATSANTVMIVDNPALHQTNARFLEKRVIPKAPAPGRMDMTSHQMYTISGPDNACIRVEGPRYTGADPYANAGQVAYVKIGTASGYNPVVLDSITYFSNTYDPSRDDEPYKEVNMVSVGTTLDNLHPGYGTTVMGTGVFTMYQVNSGPGFPAPNNGCPAVDPEEELPVARRGDCDGIGSNSLIQKVQDADPVDPAGFFFTLPCLSIGSIANVGIGLRYSSDTWLRGIGTNSVGIGWTISNFRNLIDDSYVGSCDTAGCVPPLIPRWKLYTENGETHTYTPINVSSTEFNNPSVYYSNGYLGNFTQLLRNSTSGEFLLQYRDGTRDIFTKDGVLSKIINRIGNTVTRSQLYEQNGSVKIELFSNLRTGQYLRLEHQKRIDPEFGQIWRLISINDAPTNGSSPRQVRLEYGTVGNDIGRLIRITNAGGQIWTFSYDSVGRVEKMYNPNNNPSNLGSAAVYTLNRYADIPGAENSTILSGKISQQLLPNGVMATFNYDTGSTSYNYTVTYTRSGETTSRIHNYLLNELRLPLRIYNVNSTTKYIEYIYNTDNLIQTIYDPERRRTEYQYDPTTGDLLATRACHDATCSAADTTTMTYDAYGNVTQVTEPAGAVTRYAYSAQGALTAIGQHGGAGTTPLTTTLSYDPVVLNGVAVSAGLPTKVTLPDGTVNGQTYDGRGYPLTTTLDLNGLKLTERTDYDWRGFLTATTDRQGVRTVYEYVQNPALGQFGTLGLPSAVVRDKSVAGTGRQVRTAYTYDPVGNLTRVVDDAGGLNATTTYTYTLVGTDGGYGLQAMRDAVGSVSEYTYTPIGELKTTTQRQPTNSQTARITTYHYTPEGWLHKTVRDDGQTDQTLAYNAAGQTVAITDTRGVRADYRYDAMGRLLTVLEGTRDIGPQLAVNARTDYSYDANSQVVQVTEQVDASTTRTVQAVQYDAFNRLAWVKDGLGNQTTYRYFPLLRTVETVAGDNVDAQEVTTKTIYDRAGRVERTIHDPGTGRLNLTTVYRYTSPGSTDRWTLQEVQDPRNQVTKYRTNTLGLLDRVTDAAGSVWQYAYTTLGVLSTITPPVGAATSYTSDALGRTTALSRNGQTERWGYNADGSLRQYTDFANQATAYTYNRVGWLTTIDRPGTDADASYGYTINGLLEHATSKPNGSTDERTEYTYDALNRLRTATRNGVRPLTYRYNQASDLTGITYWTRGDVTYSYDGAGRLAGVNSWAQGNTSYGYRATGALQTETRPNGVVTDYGYDTAGRLTRLHHRTSTATVNDIRYTLDASGNRLSMLDADGTTTYRYDALDRLVFARYPAISGGPAAEAEVFHYDAVGNRTLSGSNVAPFASVTASSEYSTGYPAGNVADGVVGVAGSGEWASTETNPWVQLAWPTAQTLTRVVLFDRADLSSNANEGTLSFSDGTSIVVSGIPTNGAAKDVTFAAKNVTWVKFQVSGGSGANVGLSEIQAFTGATVLTYDASDRIAPGQGYEYDATATGTTTRNGNLTRDASGMTYAYDAANRLRQTGAGGVTTTYQYDALGNLVRQSVGGVTTDLVVDELPALPNIVGEVQGTASERLYSFSVEGPTAQRDITNGVGALPGLAQAGAAAGAPRVQRPLATVGATAVPAAIAAASDRLPAAHALTGGGSPLGPLAARQSPAGPLVPEPALPVAGPAAGASAAQDRASGPPLLSGLPVVEPRVVTRPRDQMPRHTGAPLGVH